MGKVLFFQQTQYSNKYCVILRNRSKRGPFLRATRDGPWSLKLIKHTADTSEVLFLFRNFLLAQSKHLNGEERADCFALFVFLVSRDCCVALPHDATG